MRASGKTRILLRLQQSNSTATTGLLQPRALRASPCKRFWSKRKKYKLKKASLKWPRLGLILGLKKKIEKMGRKQLNFPNRVQFSSRPRSSLTPIPSAKFTMKEAWSRNVPTLQPLRRRWTLTCCHGAKRLVLKDLPVP